MSCRPHACCKVSPARCMASRAQAVQGMSCTARKVHLVDFNICGVLCRACVAFPERLQGSSGHMDASAGLPCWHAD